MKLEEIKELIIRKYPQYLYFSKDNIDNLLKDIENLSAELNEMLVNFLQDDIPPECEIAGYSINKLQEDYGMNVIAAILTLDWLAKEPEKAKKSLEQGHDFVK